MYVRVVSGFSTFKALVHTINRLLLKYRLKIIAWVFSQTTAENTATVVSFMDAVNAVDLILQGIADD